MRATRSCCFSYAPHEVEEIERAQPDLIIIDVIFGKAVLGWQVLDKLRLHRATAHIPVVVCTVASDQVREMEGYLKSMGVGVVLKPFDIDVLLSTIRTAILDAPTTVIAQSRSAALDTSEVRPPASGRDTRHCPPSMASSCHRTRCSPPPCHLACSTVYCES